MPGKEKVRQGHKRNERNSPPITRRQFLKEVGLVVGGAAVTSLAFTSACSSSAKPNPSGTTTTDTGASAGGTTTINTTSATNTSSGSTTSLDTTAFSYTPSREGLELLPIPGCTTLVASDRLYSVEHMWVKPIADDRVVVGITDKLQQLMDVVNSLSFPNAGEAVTGGEYCGWVEAWKLDVDIISPVSGTVLQTNVMIHWNLGSSDNVLHMDPYVTGWMMVIQLSKPEELDELLTPQEYIALNAKTDSP